MKSSMILYYCEVFALPLHHHRLCRIFLQEFLQSLLKQGSKAVSNNKFPYIPRVPLSLIATVLDHRKKRKNMLSTGDYMWKPNLFVCTSRRLLDRKEAESKRKTKSKKTPISPGVHDVQGSHSSFPYTFYHSVHSALQLCYFLHLIFWFTANQNQFCS